MPLAPGDAGSAEKYPNLAARRDLDRALHIRAARRMGATRKQASRHADEEVGRPISTSSTRLRRGR